MDNNIKNISEVEMAEETRSAIDVAAVIYKEINENQKLINLVSKNYAIFFNDLVYNNNFSRVEALEIIKSHGPINLL